MKRVLVTGASGFIGRALADHLASRGWSVVATSRAPLVGLPAGVVHRILPDLRQPIDWASCIADVNAVVHVAGIAHATGHIPAEDYHRVNVAPTERLAGAAARLGVHVVFISSIRAQTGPSANRVLTEDNPPVPSDAYGRSKLAAEEVVKRSGVRYTILRPTLVYGKGVKGNLASVLRLAALPLPLPLGGLENRRSLVSLQNLAGAVAFVLDAKKAEGETYLVADPEALAMREVLAAVQAGMNRPARLFRLPLPVLETGLRIIGRAEDWQRIGGSLVVSSTKLRTAGWIPEHGTRQGLMLMAASYAKSGAGVSNGSRPLGAGDE